MKKSVFLAVLAVSIFLSSSVDAAISKARAVRCFAFKRGCSMEEIQAGKSLAKRAAATIGGLTALAAITGVSAAVLSNQLQSEETAQFGETCFDTTNLAVFITNLPTQSCVRWFKIFGFDSPPQLFEGVTKAYRKMVIKVHPDKAADSMKKVAEEAFKVLSNAYQEAKKYFGE